MPSEPPRSAVRYLRALEGERWDELPGRAAARGFLSTYAHYLGLDEGPLLDAYSRGPGRTDGLGRLPEDTLPQPGTLKGRARWPAVVVVAGSVAILAAGVLALTVSGEGDEPAPAPVRPKAATAQDPVTGGSGGGGSPVGDQAAKPSAPDGDSAAKAEEKVASKRSAVELRATAEVWVCLLSGRGRALVEGETLASGDSRGPFERRSFEAAFGNGSVRLEVNGKRVEVPPSADPLAYRIGPGGLAPLEEGSRPDCL